MNSTKRSAQTRPSPMTSLHQHFPNQRSSSPRIRVAQGVRPHGRSCEPSDVCVCVCVCVRARAPACAHVGRKAVQGATNIHQGSWAGVQNYSLKCSRVVWFQNTNVFWKRKRIFKGKSSLILFLHARGQKSGISGMG